MSSDAQPHSNLDHISVAAPCHAKWSEMSGDERARFCKLCSKHVYNLSDMSRTEAEALVQQKEGKVCVRFYQRADGTVLTDNCPVGLRAARDRMRWIGSGIAALFAFAGSHAASAFGASNSKPSLKSWFVEQPAPTRAMMGEMRIATPPPATPPGAAGASPTPSDDGG